jgi:leader peptidase (prepilin peptidase)/N-methyltransferase
VCFARGVFKSRRMDFDYAQFSAECPYYFPIAVLVLGLCVGSFLNVVIYRLPKEESVVTPGSHCGCGQPIRWYDNIPVLSWLFLRGRARCCGRPFSFRYPFIELLTGVLFLTCWLRLPPAAAVCGGIFLSCLVAATFIDLDHFIIPDVFTIGLGILGVLLSILVPSLHGQHGGFFMTDSLRSGVASVQGMFIGSGLVLWIALVAEALLRKEAMGFGDVKFIGAIGAFCGWQGAVFAMFGGAVVGTVWFAAALAWEKITGRRAAAAPPSETPEGEAAPLAFGAHVPFGPMLAIAGALYFLVFREPTLRWLAGVAELF